MIIWWLPDSVGYQGIINHIQDYQSIPCFTWTLVTATPATPLHLFRFSSDVSLLSSVITKDIGCSDTHVTIRPLHFFLRKKHHIDTTATKNQIVLSISDSLIFVISDSVIICWSILQIYIPSWWFQPIGKILVKMGSSPIFRVKIKNIWVATT